MAYNPSLYNPYGLHNYQQPNWGYVQQSTSSQPINGLVSVTGIDGARAYPLPANSSMPLFDASEDILYVKTTDGAGFPTVKAYKFEQIDASATTTDYVSREEFEELSKRIDKLQKPTPSHYRRDEDGEQFISARKQG